MEENKHLKEIGMMNFKKLFICLFILLVMTLVSCGSQKVPILRVADFNMPKTHFAVLDKYDTKDYPRPVETTQPVQEEVKETKKGFEPPAGEIKVTFGGTLTEPFSNYEYNINKGGAYIDIILSGTEWKRDVGSDPELTQILIDSLQGSVMWRRQILTRLNVDNIDRLSGTLLRIRIPTPDNFNISTTEQVYLELPSELLQGITKSTTIIVRERLYIRNGNGTPEDPLSIQEARDLKALSVYPDKCFRLEKDFDMEGYDWEPFEFSGTFDGNKKTIKNMKIIGSDDGSPVGIFSVLTGTVTDLNLVDIDVQGQDHTGAIAGINKGVIKNCFVTGKVTGRNNTGGIAGTNEDGVIHKTNAMCAVKGMNYVGGISGTVSSGVLQGCCSNTSVTGIDSTGGIAGRTRYPGKISSCMVTGGFLYYSGTFSTAGRICGNPESNTLFNNAGTPEFQIMPEGTNRISVSFGTSSDVYTLTNRHGESYQCSSDPGLALDSVCDTGRKTYPDTNELFYYDLIYYGLNIFVSLENGIWMEDEIKSEKGLKILEDSLKQSFKNAGASATDLAIKPENIFVDKNVMIIHSEPIKNFRTSNNFSLKIFMPTSIMTTWSKEDFVITKNEIPYLHVMGTKDSPYPIRTEKELWHFNEDPYSHYKLYNDIILFESETWYWPEKVVGSLDFNGKRIIRKEDMFKNPYTDDVLQIP